MRRWGFVVPRYGSFIGGGAETLVREIAERLVARGDLVTVFTTTARDNRTWASEIPAGVSCEAGVEIERFEVDPRNLDQWIPLQIRISEGSLLSIDEQLTWLEESVSSVALYETLRRREEEFSAIFFAPYLFGTTFWGSLALQDRAFLIPCLHDEPYAYLDVMRVMMNHARGILWNAAGEKRFGERIFGALPGGEVGMGFTLLTDAEVAALRPPSSLSEPYLLYVGRKESGKNLPLLIDYFIEAKRAGALPENLQLVIAGGGSFDDLHRPEARTRTDIIDRGHVSEEEKRELIKGAVVLVQPSRLESFSIVLMEAWRVGTPVLVHGLCEVTHDHVVASGGGLFFSSPDDFVGTVQWFLDHPEERRAMATAGRRYVAEKYSWPAVMHRFDSVMASVRGEQHHVAQSS